MPVLDLKNCTILLKDGHSATGAVNNVAGYSIGAASMTVDGFTVAPPVGATFRMTVSGVKRYTILTSTLTTITFSPGLVAAAVDNDVIVVGARQIEAKLGDGNLTYSKTKNREYILNRGVIDEVRNGDQAPVDVSLNAQWQFITGATSDPGGGLPTIEDVLDKVGLASTWVSSDTADPCRPYCIDIEIINAPICDTVEGEYVLLKYFRYEKLDHDAKAGSIATTGKCNISTPTVTRFDQTPVL